MKKIGTIIGILIVCLLVTIGSIYLWLSQQASLEKLLQSTPHDTVAVLSTQDLRQLFTEFGDLDTENQSSFFPKMTPEEMKETFGTSLDTNLLWDLKLNIQGHGSITLGFHPEDQSPCFSAYLPSWNPSMGSKFITKSVQRYMDAQGTLFPLEQSHTISTLELPSYGSIAWGPHKNWIVITQCPHTSAKYLSTLRKHTKNFAQNESGALFSKMAQEHWNILLVYNIEEELRPALLSLLKTYNIEHNIDTYQTIGVRGTLSGKALLLEAQTKILPEKNTILALETIDPSKMTKHLVGKSILLTQVGLKYAEMFDQLNTLSPAFAQSAELSINHIKEHYDVHFVADVLEQLNNRIGLALVQDSAILGVQLWIDLKKDHTVKDTLKRIHPSFHDSVSLQEKGSSLWLEPPSSLLQEYNIPSALAVEVTPDDMVVVFGASTTHELKNAQKTIHETLSSQLRKELSQKDYAAFVLDAAALDALLNNQLLTAALAANDIQLPFSEVISHLSHVSVRISQESAYIKSTIKIIGNHERAIGDMIDTYTSSVP